MNKLEVFLEKLTANSDIRVSEYTLAFFFDDFLITFTRNDNQPDCFLDIVWTKDISFDTKFEFDLPICHIYKFLETYTESNEKKHFLIEKSVYLDFEHIINPLYDKLVHALDTCEYAPIKSMAFQTRLEAALSIKEHDKTRKIKI